MLVGAVIAVVWVAMMAVVAGGPLLAERLNPRPADQPAEMSRDEPATSSDDPGMLR
jgi:hypothetical protein